MADRMTVSVRYGSHLPALLRAVLHTEGPVLELGAGVFSTPVLHALCEIHGRPLTTIDNTQFWRDWAKRYESDGHKVIYCASWDDAPLVGGWSVALVDHSPDERRAVEIRRLANSALYIVCHDANPRYHSQYGYDGVFGEFRYKFIDTSVDPHTAVLSNTLDPAKLWGRK